MFKTNLQFFVDGEDSVGVSAEETVVAEQSETVGTVETTDTTETDTVNEVTDTGTESKRDYDKDAIYAEARRKAEAEAKEKQAKVDAEFVRRFSGYTNPLTGVPIRSQADYFAALDAQEQMRVENELKEHGLNTDLVQKLIDNNPAVRQAREYMENVQREAVVKQIEADVAELGKLDESIKSFENIPREVVEFAQNKHLSLTESYKILNYGKLTEKNVEAMRQNAVNQIKGKQHLAPVNGVATNNDEVEIPADVRKVWESIFPNKSYSELKKLYNRQL